MNARPFPKQIIQAVCRHWGITREELVERSMVGLEARQTAAFLMHISFRHAALRAALVLERDPTTVLSSIDSARVKMAADPEYAETVKRLRERLSLEVWLDDLPPVMARAKPVKEKTPETVGPPAEKVAEVRRLRRVGWSVKGLSKRTGLPPAEVAKIVGVQWGEERA